MFEVYHMDRQDLLRFNADLSNEKFQAKYQAWRKVWTCQNIRQGGMSRELLFILAAEFQKALPKEEAPEVPALEVAEVAKPAAKNGKKELQVA